MRIVVFDAVVRFLPAKAIGRWIQLRMIKLMSAVAMLMMDFILSRYLKNVYLKLIQ